MPLYPCLSQTTENPWLNWSRGPPYQVIATYGGICYILPLEWMWIGVSLPINLTLRLPLGDLFFRLILRTVLNLANSYSLL